MQYLGSVHWFKVTSLKPLATSIGGFQDNSLSFDMSNMSLDVDCSADGMVESEIICAVAQSTDCSTDCKFFIVAQHSHVVIRTLSLDMVSCSYGKCIAISRLFYQPRITLDSIKGMDKQVKLLHEVVVIPLSAPDLFKSRGMLSVQPQTTTTCFAVLAQALICLEEYCFME